MTDATPAETGTHLSGTWSGAVAVVCRSAAALIGLCAAAGQASGTESNLTLGLARGPAPMTAMDRSTVSQALSEELGVAVEVRILRDYPSLIDAQASGAVDYAVYSATAYAAAKRHCGCVDPVAVPSDPSGASGFRVVLLARKGAPAPDIEEARLAIHDADSISGYWAPVVGLAAAGETIDIDSDRVTRVHGGDAAIALLGEGAVDGAFVWRPAMKDAGSSPDVRDGFQVSWQSEFIPYGPHAVRSDLDPALRERLAAALAGLRSRRPDAYAILDPLHGGGFVPVDAADFGFVESIVDAVAAEGDQPR